GREGAAVGAHSKALGSYGDKIRAKIRGNLGFVSVNGNPSAKFLVTQLPSGEIISVKMIKSSGIPSYDSAVERAINRSSPLPLPDDRSAFQRELNLTFCPQEAANGCPP
ncbi:MAG: TonB C-terminal domain-containing protein, partial [Betaproteobacteria bacterium]|nr:TonB C-terminal domain-containing protein [Betaproteobacteria bacterium]